MSNKVAEDPNILSSEAKKILKKEEIKNEFILENVYSIKKSYDKSIK